MTKKEMTSSLNILIAAMCGDGGCVLMDWIVTTAIAAGLPVQATSIPGVAQRTGATTYYIEIWPERLDGDVGKRPIFSLSPAIGEIDIITIFFIFILCYELLIRLKWMLSGEIES